MPLRRWAWCASLLLLVGAPLSVRGLQATAYGGWPAIGVAAALFVVAGRKWRLVVLVLLTVVVSGALTYSYEVALWQGLLGSAAVTAPALLTAHLLTQGGSDQPHLDEVEGMRYFVITAASALVCGAVAIAAVSTLLDLHGTLVAALVSVLAALTAQLVVLPLLLRRSPREPAASVPELMAQRALLLVVFLSVFWLNTDLIVVFLVFPLLTWAAIRSTRREAHVQLFLVSVAAYIFTFLGLGPLVGPLRGVPQALTPTLLYLFVAAACYMTVPMALTVERLSAMTGRAGRAATTVERLLESIGGAVIIAADASGRITHFSAGAEQTLGYTAEEVLGTRPERFHTQEEIARQSADLGVAPSYTLATREMARRGQRRDWQFQHKDGSLRTASLTLSVVTDAGGEVVAYIGAGEDISERVRAQEALEAALQREQASVTRLQEVDDVKQELVSNVSHELRTPITSISGYAELLADGSLGELNDKQGDAVGRIERNTARLGLLVEDLLTLARTESDQLDLELAEVDLRVVASETFDLLEELVRARTLDVDLTLSDQPVVVLGDARALERVVTNLMSNAIKFTPDGGRISLTVQRSGASAGLTVHDTGMGIPESDQSQLFTRFFRSSAATAQAIQGTGLGLSIVHAIVTQHDGTVTVESAAGAGTTITVLLPLATTATAGASNAMGPDRQDP